jgi:hypothetical protein
MSVANADAERQPKLGRVRGVEIFQAGLRKGTRWSEADIDGIIENFRKFSTGEKKLLDPSVGCGHDDKDVLGDGNPRYGTPEKVWKEKGTCEECGGTGHWKGGECPWCDNPDGKPTGVRTLLKSDLAECPLEVGRWIANRHYNRMSAEFYHETHPAVHGIPVKGWSLKGVKFLGQTAPAVKTLAPIGTHQWETYADLECSPATFRFCDVETVADSSILMCFSEVVKVNPKHKALIDLGFDADLIAKMSDADADALHEKLKPPAPTIITFTDLDMAEAYRHCQNMGMHAEPSSLCHPGGKGKDSLRLHHSFGDVHRIMKDNGYEHHGSGEFAHKVNGHKMKFDHDDEGRPHVVKYSETVEDTDVNAKEVADLVMGQLKTEVAAQVKASLDGAVKTFSEQFEPIRKDVHDFKNSTHREAIQKFCEEQLELGRIYAFQMDASSGLPTVVDRMAKLDTATVHKFSEGGKDLMLSDLDVAKRDILQQPVRFGEKGKQGKDGRGTTEDNDKARFETFAEEFGEEFAKTGFDKEGTWKALEQMPAAERQRQIADLEKLAAASRGAA